MTDVTDDPLALLLDEVRSLRTAVEDGTNNAGTAAKAVRKADANAARIEAKSDQRTRVFVWLWSILALGLVAAVVVGSVGWAAYLRRTDRDDANRQCFVNWATSTAARTEALSPASNTRISALNDLLGALARNEPAARISQRLSAASVAGEAYEQAASDNPPVSVSALNCAKP